MGRLVEVNTEPDKQFLGNEISIGEYAAAKLDEIRQQTAAEFPFSEEVLNRGVARFHARKKVLGKALERQIPPLTDLSMTVD